MNCGALCLGRSETWLRFSCSSANHDKEIGTPRKTDFRDRARIQTNAQVTQASGCFPRKQIDTYSCSFTSYTPTHRYACACTDTHTHIHTHTHTHAWTGNERVHSGMDVSWWESADHIWLGMLAFLAEAKHKMRNSWEAGELPFFSRAKSHPPPSPCRQIAHWQVSAQWPLGLRYSS